MAPLRPCCKFAHQAYVFSACTQSATHSIYSSEGGWIIMVPLHWNNTCLVSICWMTTKHKFINECEWDEVSVFIHNRVAQPSTWYRGKFPGASPTCACAFEVSIPQLVIMNNHKFCCRIHNCGCALVDDKPWLASFFGKGTKFATGIQMTLKQLAIV